VSDPIEQLLRAGVPGGPSVEEALRSFAQIRSTPDEGRAVQRLLARDAIAPLPEPMLVAVASALVDRGEPDAAAVALARGKSVAALAMRADLLERAGDLPAALVLIEQVLARDVDWPGARERHARWREALGCEPAKAPPEPPAPAMSLAPDAAFRLLREAGRGGSAIVYEAEDKELYRRIALKVYHRPDRDRAKLLHEARVAVAVAGEGIVPVFDVDPRRGWIAMRWAPLGALGRLRDALARPDVGGDWAGRAGWIRPLARALARVHAAGWVHHDVKPANVLLTAIGVPMLGDFGTARRLGEPSPPGTPGYVSPERAAGRPSDPRDDIYGFGRVLAETLDVVGAGDEWRDLVAACTGPDEARPRDGHDLMRRIEGRSRVVPMPSHRT
jgi:eukaryotic-like serine/threonine-protein kinase